MNPRSTVWERGKHRKWEHVGENCMHTYYYRYVDGGCGHQATCDISVENGCLEETFLARVMCLHFYRQSSTQEICCSLNQWSMHTNHSLVSHINLPILSLDWVGQRLKRDMVALAVAYLFLGLGNFESAKHGIFAGMII